MHVFGQLCMCVYSLCLYVQVYGQLYVGVCVYTAVCGCAIVCEQLCVYSYMHGCAVSVYI